MNPLLPSDLMDLIFERPVMYLGSASVVKMQSFVEGFAFAFSETGQVKKDPLYDGFGQWVIDHRNTGQYPWSSIAMLIGESEANAFEVARELWNLYKHEKLGLP